jgi:hypothetical protein
MYTPSSTYEILQARDPIFADLLLGQLGGSDVRLFAFVEIGHFGGHVDVGHGILLLISELHVL